MSGEFGIHTCVFGASSTCHDDFKASEGRGNGKNLTAVIIASAAGYVFLPLFIFAEAKKREAWFETIPAEIFKESTGTQLWMTS